MLVVKYSYSVLVFFPLHLIQILRQNLKNKKKLRYIFFITLNAVRCWYLKRTLHVIYCDEITNDKLYSFFNIYLGPIVQISPLQTRLCVTRKTFGRILPYTNIIVFARGPVHNVLQINSGHKSSYARMLPWTEIILNAFIRNT